MKNALIGSLVALAVCASSQAFAQATPMFTPQQRTMIKEYVVQERIAPVVVQERLVVGTRLPAEVELRSVPPAWGPSVSQYRYVYADDRVFFVEPSSRQVVHVID